MRLIRLLALALIAAALLGACSQPAAPAPTAPAAPDAAPTGAAPDAPTSAAPADGAYPAPANGAYPGPEGASDNSSAQATADAPLVVSQPASSSVGNATGTLLRIKADGTREPISRGVLYLGNLLNSEQGVAEAMVEVDRTIAPSAVTNSRGEFIFSDIPSGRYGLMYDTFQGLVVLNNPDDGSKFIVEIVGGQILPLGELAYPLPE